MQDTKKYSDSKSASISQIPVDVLNFRPDFFNKQLHIVLSSCLAYQSMRLPGEYIFLLN